MNSGVVSVERLQAQIREKDAQMRKLHQEILDERHKRLMKSEVQLFLRGKYEGFDFDRQALKILLNGLTNYYSLDMYDGAFLPFPGSRVLLFSDSAEDGVAPHVVGFDPGGQRIPSPEVVSFDIRGVNRKSGYLTVHHIQWGFLCLSFREGLPWIEKLKVGGRHLFRHILAMPWNFFVPLDPCRVSHDRHELLMLMK